SLATTDSRKKRRRKRSSRATSGDSSLRASRAPCWSSARYTEPIAPSPTSDKIRKPATIVPVATGDRICVTELGTRRTRSHAETSGLRRAGVLPDRGRGHHRAVQVVPGSSPLRLDDGETVDRELNGVRGRQPRRELGSEEIRGSSFEEDAGAPS